MLKTVDLLVLVAFCVVGVAAYQSSVEDLVKQWAPRVWLHPKEKYNPYNISNYLTKVTPTLINCSTPVNCSYPSSYIPEGPASYSYFLVTNEDRDDLLKNKSSFLYGTNPSSENSSLHAFVDTCDTTGNHFIVTYWFFYGFDYGKQIVNLGKFGHLPFMKKINKYVGKSIGCHVGDLERMVIEFKDGEPKTLFLSVHSIGVYYEFDPHSGNFKFSKSNTNKFLKVKNPPETLEVKDGHPVIYSALGSHGVWASPGNHPYSKFGYFLSFLADEVEAGTPWDTWKDLYVHSVNSSSTLPIWYNYLGSWGNPGGNCLTIPYIKAKICEFVDGPPPINRTPDIYCSN